MYGGRKIPTNNNSVLIDGEKRLGTVTKVSASGVELNLPKALAATGRRGTSRGTVGDFIFIDCDRVVILGRITEVNIPDRDRPALEHQLEREPNVKPVGRAQLLATIQKTSQTVDRGLLVSPRIGDGVFEASGPALSSAIQKALLRGINVDVPISVPLGQISGIDESPIALPPEELFGRHCGVFGATGGGKSWTLAKLISEVINLRGKAILIDPTGEFSNKFSDATECAFTHTEKGQTLVRFPSEKISELSLFTLFSPSAQSQGPTMREAIRSLRLVKALKHDFPDLSEEKDGGKEYPFQRGGSVFIDINGCLIKAKKEIANFSKAARFYAKELSNEYCNFDLKLLPDQITNECIYPNDFHPNTHLFGAQNQSTLSFCNTLIVRMKEMLASPELQCLFGDEGIDICEHLDAFLKCPKKRIFLISFKHVSFQHHARKLLLNTLGEYLLRLARDGEFRQRPVICFLDEAHQFMGHSVGDEVNKYSLDAFGLIAKEGRKYGLTTVLATQRPRDIPQDVLSQLGALIVHRLTNEYDRETIERACGDLDRAAASFIPSLSQGEAIVIGPGIPAPLPIKITEPVKSAQPASHGPDYQNVWLKETSEDTV